jgi:formate hydrogenlyase subunit 6/NADH:ubiquinone oxidoreductase subunit I
VDEKKCVRCGFCTEICPVKAIIVEKGKSNSPAEIDRSICIHCLCCQEICPEGAIAIREGIISRRILK